jgi:hypothetical protein
MAAASNEALAVRTGVSRRFRLGWRALALSVVAAVAAVGVGVATLTSRPVVPIEEPGRETSLYTAHERTMMRLVAQGQIPAETLNTDPFIIKRLVNEGFVPRETVQSSPAPRTSLYSEQERALMNAVAGGQVPEEALDGDSFLIKRLIDQGQIPREAADTASGPQR